MSLQLGHRWVSPQTSKTDGEEERLQTEAAACEEPTFHKIWDFFTLKYLNHIEALS